MGAPFLKMFSSRTRKGSAVYLAKLRAAGILLVPARPRNCRLATQLCLVKELHRACRDLYAFEHGVIHPHVVGPALMVCLRRGIENYQVGIAAHGDGFLCGDKVRTAWRECRNQFHKTVRAEPSAATPPE